MNIDMVVPCALIINELVSNSLKHAFAGLPRGSGRTNEISIELRREVNIDISLLSAITVLACRRDSTSSVVIPGAKIS